MIKVIDTKVRYQFISERLWRELSAHEDIFRIRRSMLLWNRCYLDLQMLSPTSVPIGYSDKGLVFGFKPLEAGSLTQFQRSGLKSLGLERLRRQWAWILISMYSKFWIYFYSSRCLRLGNIVLTLVEITFIVFLYVERLSDFVQYGGVYGRIEQKHGWLFVTHFITISTHENIFWIRKKINVIILIYICFCQHRILRRPNLYVL